MPSLQMGCLNSRGGLSETALLAIGAPVTISGGCDFAVCEYSFVGLDVLASFGGAVQPS
jgi:hypothetical protein